MTMCNKCGEEYDLCCDGRIRCPNCDGPCLGCYDGPGPGEEEDQNDVDEYDPEAGDICTYDHCTFYQYGKIVLELNIEDEHVAALIAYMDKEGHWVNVFSISDHGNAHLIEL